MQDYLTYLCAVGNISCNLASYHCVFTQTRAPLPSLRTKRPPERCLSFAALFPAPPGLPPVAGGRAEGRYSTYAESTGPGPAPFYYSSALRARPCRGRAGAAPPGPAGGALE